MSRRSASAFRVAILLLAGLAPVAALAQSGGGPGGGLGGVPVQVAKVATRNVPVLLRNVGIVQAFQSVLVRARVDGTLDTINFREGQEVKPGDLLAVIDPRPYQAALDQAQAKKAADQAQMANARADLKRYSDLAQRDFASRQSVDTQQALVLQDTANIEGDQAAIDSAQLNLSFTRILAPIEGRVGLRMVDPGNLIHANDATGIVTIAQIRPISVIFALPQDTLPQVTAAMAGGTLPAIAYSSDDKSVLGRGSLLTIDNNIDQTTGTYKLKAVFANQDNKLWPGQFVNVRLQVQTLKDALTVPSAAVQHGPDGLFVYAVKPDETAVLVPIELAQDDGTVAVINKGLQAGETVVVNGQSKLQNGAHVAVVTPNGTAGG
jgi:membrane fusion protein, multidrug efflux system